MAGILEYLTGLGNLGVIANYLLLAFSFIFAYFRPGKDTGWLVVSSNTYVIMLVIMTFVSAFALSLGIVLPGIVPEAVDTFQLAYLAVFVLPPMLVMLFVFLSIIKSRVKMLSGGAWMLSFALYVLSIGQEAFSIAKASAASSSLLDFDVFSAPGLWIMIWYFFGAFAVAIAGQAIGDMVDRRFKTVASAHIKDMKAEFGENAPRQVRFEDGSTAMGGLEPGSCMAMGVAYSLWMIARHLLFP